METLKRNDAFYINNKEVNLIYANLETLHELGILDIRDDERTRRVLERAEHQYDYNTIDDEMVGKLGENIDYLKGIVTPSPVVDHTTCKVFTLKRVS